MTGRWTLASRRNTTLGLLLVALLLTPPALGKQVLSDPAMDVVPTLAGPRHVDIRAVDIDVSPDDPQAFDVALELMAVDESTAALYQVGFQPMTLLGLDLGGVVILEADVGPQGSEFRWYPQRAPTVKIPIDGWLEPGSPGKVVWHLEMFSTLLYPWAAADGFLARAQLHSEAAGLVYDEASAPDVGYIVPPLVSVNYTAAALVVEDPPDGEPAMASSEEDPTTRGLWLVRLTPNHTWAFGTAPMGGPGGCAYSAKVLFYPGPNNPPLEGSLDMATFRGEFEVLRAEIDDGDSMDDQPPLMVGKEHKAEDWIVWGMAFPSTLPERSIHVDMYTMCVGKTGFTRSSFDGETYRRLHGWTPAPGVPMILVGLLAAWALFRRGP